MKKVTIIGVGLMGGSLALVLRNSALADTIIGVESSSSNAQAAMEMGLIDDILPLEEAIVGSDLVVIATPVNTAPLLTIKILNSLANTSQNHTVVMDMGSTKAELCGAVEHHPLRGRFVASHPMWGTEHSGPQAAQGDAFRGQVAVICDKEHSDTDAALLVEQLYKTMQMKLLYMNAEEHDLHTAYISHISHITSFALALTVLEKEREESCILDLAGGGFESTVRLAKSSADMWVPIFMENKYNVLDVLRENIHQLQIIRRLIERDDTEGLRQAIEKANNISKILN